MSDTDKTLKAIQRELHSINMNLGLIIKKMCGYSAPDVFEEFVDCLTHGFKDATDAVQSKRHENT